MQAFPSALRTVLWILGIWTAVSVIGCVPLVLWFRARARRNDLLAREGRRKAWAEATDGEIASR